MVKKLFVQIILFVTVFGLQAQTALPEFYKGVAAYNNAAYSKAVDFFGKLKEGDRNYIEAQYFKGKALLELKQLDEAVEVLLYVNGKKNAYAAYELAQAYALQDNAPLAVQYLEDHMRSRYQLPMSAIRLDKTFYGMSEKDEWIGFWKEDWYTKKEMANEEVLYLLKQEKMFEALELADASIKKYKKSHQLLASRANVYASLDNNKAAVSNYNKAIKLSKRNADYFIERGKAYLKLEKFEKALADFEKAIKYSDTHLELYLLKAEVYIGIEKYNKALSEINTFLEYLPNDANAIRLCADVHYQKGAYKEAVNYYSSFMQIDSLANAQIYLLRGNALLKDHQYHKAYNDYSMGLDLDPYNPMLYLQRGYARLRTGKYKGACADWERADQMGSLEAKKNILQFCK